MNTLLRFWVACQVWWRSRVQLKSQAGFGTLEWVVIAVGVFVAAGVAVAAIRGAVESNLDQLGG